MAAITIYRSRLSRAQQEDLDYVHPDLQRLGDNFIRMFNGNHQRNVVEHYCYEELGTGSREWEVGGSNSSVAGPLLSVSVSFAALPRQRWTGGRMHGARVAGAPISPSLRPPPLWPLVVGHSS